MVSVLYAGGDSNTYGEEILPSPFKLNAATGVVEPKPTPQEHLSNEEYRLSNAWPSRLAKLLSIPMAVNTGYPGASNARIFREVMAWIGTNIPDIRNSPSDYIVVIGWTETARSEFWDNTSWRRLAPSVNQRREDRAYYGTFHSAKQAEILSWQYVVSLHHTLCLLGVRHLFFSAFSGFPVSQSPQAMYLYPLIDPSIIVPTPMHHWCTSNGYACGPGSHILEDGNAAWAEHLASFLQ